jgi:endonuclease/exonuclease/phosphatase (EEP) superfamily protein YafD
MLNELRGALSALALVVLAVLVAVSFDFGIPGQELLQSLRFHIAAVLVLAIVLLLATGAWWRAVILILPLIASLGEGASIIYAQQQLRTAAAPNGATPLLKLMSFNLLNTNLANGEAIADMMIASGADVIMVMEALPLAPHEAKLRAAYPHVAGCTAGPNCTTVILSKWPLGDARSRDLSQLWPSRLVTAIADVRGTRVNLVAVHMSKPYFDNLAAGEAYTLARVIGRMEGPVLLAGDFNAAAWSGTIARLSGWEDLAPGPSYPATWPVPLGPFGVPIDNVFTRAPLLIETVEAIPDAMGSNHRGLIASVSLANPA